MRCTSSMLGREVSLPADTGRPAVTGRCCASRAVCARVHSVDGHPLPIDELKGVKAVEAIDLRLSSKRLGPASAIMIAACIGGNASLKSLKCAGPHLPNMAGRPVSLPVDMYLV